MKQKRGRKTDYDDAFAERLAAFGDQPQSLMVRGRLSDARVGTMLGVSRETVRRWRVRVPGRDDDFKPDFAAAWDACQLAVDAGAIKRSMTERAIGFVQKKRVRELMPVGPRIPGMAKMDKDTLRAAAAETLGLALDSDMPLEAMQQAVRDEIRAQTKEKLVVTKEEQTTLAGDVAAAKLVLTNIDKSDDKWNTSEKTENQTTVRVDGLTELLEQVDGDGMRLPGEFDRTGTGRKAEGPAVAAE